MTPNRNNQADSKGSVGLKKTQRIRIRSKKIRKLDLDSHAKNSKSLLRYTNVPINTEDRSAGALHRLTLQIGSHEIVWAYRVTDEILKTSPEETEAIKTIQHNSLDKQSTHSTSGDLISEDLISEDDSDEERTCELKQSKAKFIPNFPVPDKYDNQRWLVRLSYEECQMS